MSDKIEQNIISTIGREIRFLVRRMTSLYNSIETLDRAAVLLLVELQAQGPLGISTLAASLQLDISTASRQAAALENKGLVERLSSPEDGRVSLLQITDLGAAQLQEVRQIYHSMLAEILEDWSEEDLHLFKDLLARYNRAMLQRGKSAGHK
jgi:DNA-binding MarR family transcriptional regulator